MNFKILLSLLITLIAFQSGYAAAAAELPGSGIVQPPTTNDNTILEGYGKWGDMLLPLDFFSNSSTRNAIPHAQMRWTNRVVPYVLDNSVAQYTNLINAAFGQYHSRTCIRFVPRTNQQNYIRIFSGQGCYSYVGMINRGAQDVSLGNGCMFVGTIVHELGHAIGFFHEQNRSDRDNHLNIYWNNIQSGMESQFALLAPNQNILYDPFDTNSIMLYGNNAFSRDGRSKTMEHKAGVPLREPYDKQGLSTSDLKRIQKMYNC